MTDKQTERYYRQILLKEIGLVNYNIWPQEPRGWNMIRPIKQDRHF